LSIRNNYFSGESRSLPLIQQVEQTYTLNDLRNDDEFNEVTTRFLQSIGEGSRPDDLFGYFRGNEYNIGDALQAYSATEDFTEQDKKDYIYLQNKFNNANVGDWIEWIRTAGDIGQELITDPTLIASALLIPWSGGTSLAGRIATGKAVTTALKKLGNPLISQGLTKTLSATGQVLKSPLSARATHALVGAEGALWGSSYDFLKQQREINLGQRDEYDVYSTLTTGALGGVLGYGASFGIRHLANTPSYLRSIESKRLARIDNNSNYKASDYTLLEKGAELGLRALNLFTKPTSAFLIKAKRSKTLQDLMKIFRYDSLKPMAAEKAGTTPRLGDDYNQSLLSFIHNRIEKFHKILDENKLLESLKTKEVMPFSKGALINPFRSKTKRTRESIFRKTRLSEETNDKLWTYLVTGEKKGLSKDIIKAGDEIRALFDDILKTGKKAGLDIGEIENFFPRVWLSDALQENNTLFIKKLARDEFGGDVSKAKKVLEDMLDLNKTGIRGFEGTYHSAVHLSSIKAERKLLKIKDENYSQFLDKNIMNVVEDYIFQAGKLIVRKEKLGEDVAEFSKRWIKPIQDELGNVELSARELKKLERIYLFTTGQAGYINNPLGRFLSDLTVTTTQTALLPFATVTSIAELAVPLLRGAKPISFKSRAKGEYSQAFTQSFWDTTTSSLDMWWKDVQKSIGKDVPLDVRSKNLRELNAFGRAVNLAKEDRAQAIFGQAHGKNFTKIQNVFFKGILLHDWTRYVQLIGYDYGKGLIYRNLNDLVNGKNLTKLQKQRIAGELNELGVDIQKGVQWIKNGAEQTDNFYLQDVRKAASRYTDEVVMNPTTAANQKPLLHSQPATKWAFGLLGFPTAYSNTALKNAVREITKDARYSTNLSTPAVFTGILISTALGIAGNTIRTKGKALEEYNSGEKPLWSDDLSATGTDSGLLNDALQRSGLFGPFEYYVRFKQARKYQNDITAALSTLTGPAVGDILRYVRTSQYQGANYEAILRRAPFITLLRSSFPETYEKVLEAVKELDKSSAPVRPEEDEIPRFGLSTGGLVSGPKVPATKENPADRINPFTNEPYQEQMDRLGFAEGTNANMINLIFLQKWHRKNFTDVDEFKGTLDKELKGKTVSMRLGTFGIDGKTYILPTYAKGIGKILPVETFIQDIKDGKIRGYKTVDEAEKQLEILRDKIIYEERKGFSEGKKY
jgi:hypothetical protein